MQIVIDISEDTYNYIKTNGARIPYSKLTDVIKNGTPLSKRHENLIDAGEAELISKLEILKAELEWYGPLEYQVVLDEVIKKLKEKENG